MSAFHVVVRPRPDHAPSPALGPLYGLFDVIVDGVNVTARVAEGVALNLLSELAHAVAALCAGRSDRHVVQLYAEEDVWELGLERDGEDVLVTVFRSGPAPEVAVHERRVGLLAFRTGLLQAVAEQAQRTDTPESARRALAAGRAAVETSFPPAARVAEARVPVQIAPTARGGFAFHADVAVRRGVRARGSEPRGTSVERADLHALLLKGDFAVVVRGRSAPVPAVHPFLVAERLIPLAEEVLDAFQGARAIFRRIHLGDCRLGVRRGPGDGPLDVTVGSGFGAVAGKSVTFPAIDAIDFADSAVAFARKLVAEIVAHDASQAKNLRLKGLVNAFEGLADRIDDLGDDDSMTNPEPDSYRSYAPKKGPVSSAKGTWSHGGKMRFVPKWVATVPNVDLKSTFLCGDKIVVGAAREIACIDRNTGTVLWRAPSSKGGSVATPSGIARIEPDGRIVLRDLESGEARFSVRVAPRTAGGATGAVVHSPGLPKLLVVAEGDRKITALDLVTGEVRWRHTGRRPAAYRMRRAGKLLLVTGGDSSLFALDVATGDVVWRVRDRLPFSHALALDHDSAFALSGAPGGRFRLHHVDPWTGNVRCTMPLDDATPAGGPPLVTQEIVAVPTRDAAGTGIRAFRRSDGAPLWDHPTGLLSPLAAWLVVDDGILANSGSGVLMCLDEKTGDIRYSHVFAGSAESDQPRRLEPVLRSGALFVPQHQVYVVRPRDGEIIGTVPSDLIADLLRVDERCNVYLGEESGHLAAFGAAPRLALVR
ncbi:MAG TPA: PQQ-binding-like beta-propeller repeat protein [Polyangiaceae bacterium]|nr:PQQ-binding-like beta-propeller repeat protein [Polyangiaceae bacterium]